VAGAALAMVLSSGCAEEAAAARVGDETISNEDLMAEVKALAGNKALLQQFQIDVKETKGEAEGSYSQKFVATVLVQRIGTMLIERALDDKDVEVTDADIAQADDTIDQALGAESDKLPEKYRKQLAHDVAVNNKLAEAFPSQSEASSALQKLAKEADISVSSRYGNWDPNQFTITPPVGASTTSTTSTTTPAGG
jgi:hypothetical protein